MNCATASSIAVDASGTRAVATEALGTALLLACVVGSGIMGVRLAGGNTAIALLANSLATGAALIALVAAFGPISGAHFNPAVTACGWWKGELSGARAAAYVLAQVSGGWAGVVVAHAMFEVAPLQVGTTVRTGTGQWLAELVATAGLLAVVRGVSSAKSPHGPLAVGAWVTGAYWFTASTAFANPAVTLARCWTDTFAGIRPADAPAFVAAQLAGTVVAAALWPRAIQGESTPCKQ